MTQAQQSQSGGLSASGQTVDSALAAVSSPSPLTRSARLTALDAWRGSTVMLMLLVNNIALGNRTPSQLLHAGFGGLTLTDLVFPWFLLCAGAALPYSQAALTRAGITGHKFYRRLFERAALLYLVGAFVTSVTEHRLTLGLGVIQLIALATLFAALVAHLKTRAQLSIAALLLIVYGAFLAFGPQSSGAGSLSETLNPVQHLNDTVLAKVGLRGLLSVIPTTALVMFGSVAARPLQRKEARAGSRLLCLGAALSLIGYTWAAGGQMPFSKALWTPPYILYSAGLGILGILCYWWLADSGQVRWGKRLLAPATIPGRNALAAYVLPILIKVWILNDWQVRWTGKTQSIAASLLEMARSTYGNVGGGWTYTLAYLLVVWLGLAWMSRRGMIWKV